MQNRHEIVILGPERTGKTQLVNRLLGHPFNPEYQVHIGIEIKKTKTPEEILIFYRDIAGDTDLNLIQTTIKMAHQIYMVFDASNADGLEKLKYYIQDLTFPQRAQITLIGTHADRSITEAVDNAAKVYAYDKKVDYCTISSLQDNHPVIQQLREKSSCLLSTSSSCLMTAPIKRQASVNGSVHSGERVLTLSSTSLREYDAYYNAAANNRKSGADKQRYTHDYDPSYSPGQSRYRGSKMSSAPANRCSCALRMAGMAMILAALIGLIYIALVVVNILSAAALISLMNHIVVGVGSLLGASSATSLMTISQVGASLNVSTTAVAGMFMTVPSLALLVAGYGAFRAGGQKPDQNPEDDPGFEPRKRRY
ncbi:MAG: hypothetical protein KBB94_01115 [Legionellaceae bacterium]|nr:hypothetical protein [Legionellaceae bacterium]MBP9774697.1 hypothetical protein [Legionellaceae bacterium]